MKSKATTAKQYLEGLPQDRRTAISAIRRVILANLPAGYKEYIQYGHLSYAVPHSIYPAGYHSDPTQPLPYAALASQKNHMALYLCTVYGHKETSQWFQKAWRAAGKKLDMGKSCVRFKKLDDVPLEVVGEVIARTPVKTYIACIEKALGNRAPRKPAKK